MLKKLSKKTSFILIGIVVGLFVGVSIKQAFGGTDTSTVDQRNGNLAVNIANTYLNGLLVPYGNVGIGTITPSVKLEVVGNIKSTGLCIGITCIDENQFKAMLGTGATGTPPPVVDVPTSYGLAVIKNGTGLGTVTSSPNGINCGSACAYTFPSNTSVTLTANKTTGSTFTGWGGWCGGTSTCQASMTEARNVTATFNTIPEGGTTPPAQPTCTGSHPAAGNGVQLSYYDDSKVCISPGPCNFGTPNTVWKYNDRSCGWSCESPKVRNGDFGCENPPAGSGVTVTVNDLSTGRPFSGVSADVWFLPYTTVESRSLGSYTTGTNGQTLEFWIGKKADRMASSMLGILITKDGYKIRTATGCTPNVRQQYSHRGAQENYCMEPSDGTPVVIDMVPGDISTQPITHFEKLTYHRGETLTGSISGGDPNDTWACMDTPNTVSGHECNSGRGDVWRKLTVPYDNHADGWQIVSTNQGDTIELGGLLIEQGNPLGTYTQYVKTGQWSAPSEATSKSVTVVQ